MLMEEHVLRVDEFISIDSSRRDGSPTNPAGVYRIVFWKSQQDEKWLFLFL